MCPMGRDRRCLHGVGGIFIPHILPIGNFILDLFFTSWYCSFTTNGKGEWRGNGPLKAGTGRRKPQQVRARQAQAFGSGKHATAGNGVMWRQSERRSPPLRRCTRNSRQGVQTRAEHTRLRHKDRAVKRDEIRILTSGRSVDFLTIHRPAWERAPAGIGPVGCLP